MLRRSLRFSTLEGIFAEMVGACSGGAVLTAWALAFDCPPLVIGLFAALSPCAQFVQLPAAWVTTRFGARRTAIVAVTLSRQLFLPLTVLPWLPIPLGIQQLALGSVAVASALLSMIGNNAWTAWMGTLVPSRLRGRYFGRRTSAYVLAQTVASLSAGVALDAARRADHRFSALSALAAVACAAGGITTWLMCQQHDSEPAERPRFGWADVLVPIADAPFRRALWFQLLWSMASGLSAGYLTLHMAKNLAMGFSLIAMQGGAVAILKVITTPRWGRLMDRSGVPAVLGVTCLGLSLSPFVWLAPRATFLWPVLIDTAISGALGGGQSLALFTLPIAASQARTRAFYVGAFSTAGGVAFLIGTLTGGSIAAHVPEHFSWLGREWCNLHAVFALAGLARLCAAFSCARLSAPATLRSAAVTR